MLLAQLKEALKPLTELAKVEAIVELADTAIHIRLLTPSEELACQHEAQHFLNGIEDEEELESLSRTKAVRFLDAFRLSILSRAIVQVGDLDLRGVPFLETGEVLDNGVAVKITKVEAVRGIVEDLPRTIQTQVMEEFQKLSETINVLVSENTDGDFVDTKAEIADLEERLEQKKAELSRSEAPVGSDIQKLMRTVSEDPAPSFVSERKNTAKDISESSKLKEEEEQEDQESVVEPPANEQDLSPVVEKRKPIVPSKSSPPTTVQEEKKAETEVEDHEALSSKPKVAVEPNIFQEQEFPKRREPKGLQEGVEVYRLPAQVLSEPSSAQKPKIEEPVVSSRNPRFRSPSKI